MLTEFDAADVAHLVSVLRSSDDLEVVSSALRSGPLRFLEPEELHVLWCDGNVGDAGDEFDHAERNAYENSTIVCDGLRVCAPILFNGASVGVLAIRTTHRPVWTAERTTMLEALTALLGVWRIGWRRTVESVDNPIVLSPRQMQILTLIGRHTTFLAMARRLGCSESTVARESRHLMTMLGAHHQDALIASAINHGLLPERRGQDQLRQVPPDVLHDRRQADHTLRRMP